MILSTRAGALDLSNPPLLMGILNVTPDSFADGGRYNTLDEALARAEAMGQAGASLIDVGGESTRPGSDPVPLEVELKRVIPVIQTLASRLPSLPLSVDTTKAEVARQALEEGASLVNDVSALGDPWMPAVLRDHNVPVILMHRQGNPRTMQDNPVYENLLEDILNFFRERLGYAETKGIRTNNILLDPGFGFGKTTDHNLCLLNHLPYFLSLKCPLVVGVSRKSFIGRLGGGEESPWPPSERGEGTLAANLWAAAQGVHVLRVHDVKETARALTVWKKITNVERVPSRLECRKP
ncbi:MAG: dihydropteroate synthase [Elusimicrobia bacterium]|jgi:dihydropteroate synthase|nr:dihydropteroate synthase [Elusimicrobiota bacterium]